MDAPGEPWDRYARAVVEIDLGDGTLELTPRSSDSRSARAASDPAAAATAVGGVLAGPVTVLTAGDPYPASLTADENRRRNARLVARLDALGLPHLPALGRSPDRRESEESRALLGVDPATGLAVAAEFDQLAVFVIDGATIACVAVGDAAVMTRRGYGATIRR